ncbi:MAG: hypothetical protein RL174_719 [Actinomycetota bacterium]
MVNQIAAKIIDHLREAGLFLATAESLTGGQLSAKFVDIPGASDVFMGGLVTYQTGLKSAWLGVDPELLNVRGAVDPEVARQMALGVAARAATDLKLDRNKVVAIATTGVAGPTEQDGQPVGKVFIAVAIGENVRIEELALTGNRDQIRTAASEQALQLAWEQISI